ncbi:MAG: amidase family protein, partial [Acidimicrobiales bacterium]
VGIASYLAEHPRADARTLGDLISYNLEHPQELAHFGQEIFVQSEATAGLEDPKYLAAVQRCRRAGRDEGIDSALAAAEVDALAVPSYLPAWKSDLVNGDPHGLYSSAQLPAVAGYPAVTVPVGLVGGLPVGLTIFGTARSEQVLLRLGGAVEAAAGPLPPPTFRAPEPG